MYIKVTMCQYYYISGFLAKKSWIAFFMFLFILSCRNSGSGDFSVDPSSHPSKDTLQQCALDLCGPPKVSFYSHSDMAEMAPKDLREKWEDEFRALGGREIVEKWVERQIGPFDRAQRAFLESDMFRKSGFDFLQPEDYEKLSNTFFDPYIQQNVDYRQPPSNRLRRMRIEWPREVSKQLKEGAESYIRDLKRKVSSSPIDRDGMPDSLLSAPHFLTPMEAVSMFIEKWEDFIKKYKRERELNGTFDASEDIAGRMNKMEEIMKEIRASYSKGENIGFLLADQAEAAMESLEESFIAEQEKTGSRGPEKKLLCGEQACRKALQEIITELFRQYEMPLPRKDKEDYQWAQCLSQFILIKQLERGLPNGLDISYVKRNFLEKALKDFSSSTKESFENYINNDFYMGLSRNFILPDFWKYNKLFLEEERERNSERNGNERIRKDLLSRGRQDLVDYIDRSKKRSKKTDFEEKGNAKLIYDMYLNRRIPLRYESGSHPRFEDELLCESNTGSDRLVSQGPRSFMRGAPDSANPSKLALLISPASFFHPDYGRWAVSREMGQLLLSWMIETNQLSDESYSSYKQLRECASKRYKRKRYNKLPESISELRNYKSLKPDAIEEDTADLIAYLADLDRKNTYHTCSLVDITEDKAKYKDLSIIDDNWESRYSTPLLRVIFEAIHKRAEFSPSCQRIVEQYKDDIDFTPCF